MSAMQRPSLLLFAIVAADSCTGTANDPSRGEVKMTASEGTFDPEAKRKIETAVIAYVDKEYHWPRDAYQIEPRRRTPDGSSIVVDVVHRDDTRPGPGGGAGKSVQLQLNAATLAVEKVLHFQ